MSEKMDTRLFVINKLQHRGVQGDGKIDWHLVINVDDSAGSHVWHAVANIHFESESTNFYFIC